MERRTQQERSASTQKALLDAATTLIAERGYDGVALEEIAAAAGVSKGSVYHHFDSKRELFAAVFERLALQVREVFAQLFADHEDPYEGMRAALDLLLDLCVDPTARRIGMTDAPAVLGWERWRSIQLSTFLELFTDQLRAADALHPLPVPPELLTPFFSAISLEAGLQIAAADDREAASAEIKAACSRVLDSLMPLPPEG